MQPGPVAPEPVPPEEGGNLDPFDAVILAGGSARRLGGVDKPGLVLAGTTVLERVAVAAGAAARIVVVGPHRFRPTAHYVREEPAGAGPVPALRAGIAQVRSSWVALLAGDMPLLTAHSVSQLRRSAHAHGSAGGAVLVDGDGRYQWLAGMWATAPLRDALGKYSESSLRGLLAPLDPTPVPAPETTSIDCDTPEELELARRLLCEDRTASS